MREMYAFWKYDICPFMICGRVLRFSPDDSGAVSMEQYGRHYFHPMIIIDGERGRIAYEEIRALQSEYRDKEYALKEEYRLAALRVVGLE